MGKLSVVVAAGVGYVLGARAGRERYDQIVTVAGRFWHDPRVQRQASVAVEFAKDKAPDVGEKVVDVARSAAAKVTSSSDDSDDLPPRDDHGRFTSNGG